MQSNGGENSFQGAMARPVQMTVSGPTGGVVATRELSKLINSPNLVSLDMGGTSTDCAAVINFQERFTTNFEIEWGVPIQVPMIDVRTIGAGGGSIAWIDRGLLKWVLKVQAQILVNLAMGRWKSPNCAMQIWFLVGSMLTIFLGINEGRS